MPLRAGLPRHGFDDRREPAPLAGARAAGDSTRPWESLFEAALSNFTPRSPAEVATGNPDRGPLLLTAGGKDHTVPEAVTKSEAKLYRKSPAITDYIEFPDRGHSLTIDHGWRDVAETTLGWLREHDL